MKQCLIFTFANKTVSNIFMSFHLILGLTDTRDVILFESHATLKNGLGFRYRSF